CTKDDTRSISRKHLPPGRAIDRLNTQKFRSPSAQGRSMSFIESLEDRKLFSASAPSVHAALRGRALFVVATRFDDAIDIGVVPASAVAGATEPQIAVSATSSNGTSAFAAFPASKIRRIVVLAGPGDDSVDTS